MPDNLQALIITVSEDDFNKIEQSLSPEERLSDEIEGPQSLIFFTNQRRRVIVIAMKLN